MIYEKIAQLQQELHDCEALYQSQEKVYRETHYALREREETRLSKIRWMGTLVLIILSVIVLIYGLIRQDWFMTGAILVMIVFGGVVLRLLFVLFWHKSLSRVQYLFESNFAEQDPELAPHYALLVEKRNACEAIEDKIAEMQLELSSMLKRNLSFINLSEVPASDRSDLETYLKEVSTQFEND